MEATKRNKIIYWVFTIWMSLGMVSSAIVQILMIPEEVQLFEHLGFPLYFMHMLGILKLLGVAVVLMPKLPVLKEWAYSAFFFTMLVAFLSHIAMKDGFAETFPPAFLLTLTMLSWYFRPTGRRVNTPQ